MKVSDIKLLPLGKWQDPPEEIAGIDRSILSKIEELEPGG